MRACLPYICMQGQLPPEWEKVLTYKAAPEKVGCFGPKKPTRSPFNKGLLNQEDALQLQVRGRTCLHYQLHVYMYAYAR